VVVGMRTFRGDEGEVWLAKEEWSIPSPSALALFESAKSSASASGVRKGPPRCAARPWAWDMADSGCRESRVSTAGGGGGGGALRDSARVKDSSRMGGRRTGSEVPWWRWRREGRWWYIVRVGSCRVVGGGIGSMVWLVWYGMTRLVQ
jgi:hypothetical protein